MLDAILSTCIAEDVDEYAAQAAVLTGWAESTFHEDAKNPTDDTWGTFQQNPRWWPNARKGTGPQCETFLERFPAPDNRDGRLVVDCWRVQNWSPPNTPTPYTNYEAWLAMPNTLNYTMKTAIALRMAVTGRVVL